MFITTYTSPFEQDIYIVGSRLCGSRLLLSSAPRGLHAGEQFPFPDI